MHLLPQNFQGIPCASSKASPKFHRCLARLMAMTPGRSGIPFFNDCMNQSSKPRALMAAAKGVMLYSNTVIGHPLDIFQEEAYE